MVTDERDLGSEKTLQADPVGFHHGDVGGAQQRITRARAGDDFRGDRRGRRPFRNVHADLRGTSGSELDVEGLPARDEFVAAMRGERLEGEVVQLRSVRRDANQHRILVNANDHVADAGATLCPNRHAKQSDEQKYT